MENKVTIPQTYEQAVYTTKQRLTYRGYRNMSQYAMTTMFGFPAASLPRMPTPPSLQDNQHYQSMVQGFTAFMDHFRPPVRKSYDSMRIPDLTADSDIERWFEKYKLETQRRNHKLTDKHMLKFLPMHLDRNLENIYRQLPPENRKTLEQVQEHFQRMFRDRASDTAWSTFHSTRKDQHGAESFEAFAIRCKANFDDIERHTGRPPHAQMLRDMLVQSTPPASQATVMSAADFEEIIIHFRAIDRLSRQKTTTQTDIALLQELREAKERLRLLEASQQDRQATQEAFPIPTQIRTAFHRNTGHRA